MEKSIQTKQHTQDNKHLYYLNDTHKQIMSHPLANAIDNLIHDWINAPLFYKSGDTKLATKLVEISLSHTYLFSRYTLPSYAGHVFYSLRKLPPADDHLGEILKTNSNVFHGELFTNNVFHHPDACHAHYYDMKKALLDLEDKTDLVAQFEQCMQSEDYDHLINNNIFMNDALLEYALFIQAITESPLTSFLITLISEKTIPESYKTILHHITDAPCFGSFKYFITRHINLDNDEHGPATCNWMNFYLDNNTIKESELDHAMECALKFIQLRLKTYEV